MWGSLSAGGRVAAIKSTLKSYIKEVPLLTRDPDAREESTDSRPDAGGDFCVLASVLAVAPRLTDL